MARCVTLLVVIALFGPVAAQAEVELVHLRTELTKTFERPDGSRRQPIGQHSLNYRAGNEWLPVDLTLVESARPGYGLSNETNTLASGTRPRPHCDRKLPRRSSWRATCKRTSLRPMGAR